MALAGRVYLDANGFIFYGEQHAVYARCLHGVFKAAEAGNLTLVTSDLTLLEVLVRPYQMGDMPLVAAYERLLSPRPELERGPVSTMVLKRAAELRATHKMRTPDAIHIATAELAHCGTLLSEDRGLKVPGGLSLVRISDLPP